MEPKSKAFGQGIEEMAFPTTWYLGLQLEIFRLWVSCWLGLGMIWRAFKHAWQFILAAFWVLR